MAAASSVLPPVLLEIQPDFVAGFRLGLNKQQADVRRMSVALLPPAALAAHAVHANLASEDAVGAFIASTLEAVGFNNERIGLLVPDACIRVAVLSIATLPKSESDTEQLVAWRLAEILPFPREEARTHYQVLACDGKGVQVLAVGTKDSVLAEYESALGRASAAAALVLPSTMALLPLLPQSSRTGQLLVHVCGGSMTTVVILAGRVRFWRNREVRRDPAEAIRDIVTEAGRVRAASRDHLKVELEEAWLCVRPTAPPGLHDGLARVLACPVMDLTPAPEGDSLPSAEEKQAFERYGAVAAGLVQNASGPGSRRQDLPESGEQPDAPRALRAAGRSRGGRGRIIRSGVSGSRPVDER